MSSQQKLNKKYYSRARDFKRNCKNKKKGKTYEREAAVKREIKNLKRGSTLNGTT